MRVNLGRSWPSSDCSFFLGKLVEGWLCSSLFLLSTLQADPTSPDPALPDVTEWALTLCQVEEGQTLTVSFWELQNKADIEGVPLCTPLPGDISVWLKGGSLNEFLCTPLPMLRFPPV